VSPRVSRSARTTVRRWRCFGNPTASFLDGAPKLRPTPRMPLGIPSPTCACHSCSGVTVSEHQAVLAPDSNIQLAGQLCQRETAAGRRPPRATSENGPYVANASYPQWRNGTPNMKIQSTTCHSLVLCPDWQAWDRLVRWLIIQAPTIFVLESAPAFLQATTQPLDNHATPADLSEHGRQLVGHPDDRGFRR
jgi:hypothetical protein